MSRNKGQAFNGYQIDINKFTRKDYSYIDQKIVLHFDFKKSNL